MKISIGAGDTPENDYITIDIDPKTNPTHILNLETDILPFTDSSVKVVKAHHIFEHLGEGFFHCIKELHRICEHGAIIDIRVPHPRHESFLADPTHRRPITPMTFKLFSKKFNELCRKNKEPASRLGEYYEVDFEIVDFEYIPDTHELNFLQSQGISPYQDIQKYAEHHNNLISEIHIKLVVLKND
jgi:predicted SAM-dependent methyltransferase